MKNNTLITETDTALQKRESVKALTIVFLAFSLIACLGFLVAWQTFLFLEVIVLIATAVAFVQKMRVSHAWRLEFIDNFLIITNLNTKEEYEVYGIPASDFVITQTKSEKRTDHCSLMIKNTVFLFGSVKNCSQLKAYIRENY